MHNDFEEYFHKLPEEDYYHLTPNNNPTLPPLPVYIPKIEKKSHKKKPPKPLLPEESFSDMDVIVALAKEHTQLPDSKLKTLFNLPGIQLSKALTRARDSGALTEFNKNKADALDLAQMKIMEAFSRKELAYETPKDLAQTLSIMDKVSKTSKDATTNSMAVLYNIISEVTNSRLRGGVMLDVVPEPTPESKAEESKAGSGSIESLWSDFDSVDPWKNLEVDL